MSAYAIVILVMAVAYTFYMGYSDGSNAVATCVASHSLKPYTAIVISALCKFATPLLLCYLIDSYGVAVTVASLIDQEALSSISGGLVGFIFLLSTMLSALLWSGVSAVFNVPNSTSHTLLGGLVVAGVVTFGTAAIDWNAVGIKVILMVFLAPVICMSLGFLLEKLIARLTAYLTRSAEKLFKGAQVVNMMVLSGAISLNNTQKGLGVYLLAVVLTGQGAASTAQAAQELPVWIMIIFCAAIALGLMTGGFRLIYAIGKKLFALNLLQSYVAQTASMAVSVFSTAFGIPISTGQVMSSSIIGVGMAQRVKGVRWTRAIKIFTGWIITFPVAMGVGAAICALLNVIIPGGSL